MKTLIILILLAVLGGGAYLSKPSEQSFREMIHKQMQTQKKSDLFDLIRHGFKGEEERFLETCKYQDHILWATVEQNGKKIYTGAFSTWFASDLKIAKAN